MVDSTDSVTPAVAPPAPAAPTAPVASVPEPAGTQTASAPAAAKPEASAVPSPASPAPPAPPPPLTAADYALGKPADWPGDTPFDDALAASVAGAFGEVGVPKDLSGPLFEKLAKLDLARVQAVAKAQADADAEARKAAQVALATAWGERRGENEQAALRAAHYVFGAAFAQALKDMGPEANPDIWLGLARVAPELGEMRLGGGGNGGAAAQPKPVEYKDVFKQTHAALKEMGLIRG